MKNFILGLAISALFGTAAIAGEYPERDIDLVSPWAPGGGVDTTSRIIAEAANTFLDGVEMSVSNREGGGGVVGQTYGANADPDGYTVLAMTSSVVTNPQLKGASYTVDDFIPVAVYNLDPEVIVVPANSPYETIAEFIEAAEAKPLNIVTAGVGTSHHMAGLALERSTDAQFNYVPAKGFGEQLQAVMGGHVDGSFWSMGEAAKHAAGGGVRMLAVASDMRDEAFPDVPTFEESGLGLSVWATFRGWAVPQGTSDEVVTFLSDLLGKVSESPEYQKKMSDAGFTAIYRDAEAFEKVVSSYATETSAIIEENGLGQ